MDSTRNLDMYLYFSASDLQYRSLHQIWSWLILEELKGLLLTIRPYTLLLFRNANDGSGQVIQLLDYQELFVQLLSYMQANVRQHHSNAFGLLLAEVL